MVNMAAGFTGLPFLHTQGQVFCHNVSAGCRFWQIMRSGTLCALIWGENY